MRSRNIHDVRRVHPIVVLKNEINDFPRSQRMVRLHQVVNQKRTDATVFILLLVQCEFLLSRKYNVVTAPIIVLTVPTVPFL